MWNYLYFIIYLWEQDKDDDDGLEQYVRRCVEAKDIAWFPMNKAMRLDDSNSAEDDLRQNVQEDLKVLEDNMLEKLKQFQSDTEETLDKIVYSLNNTNNSDLLEQPTLELSDFGPNGNGDDDMSSAGDMKDEELSFTFD